MSRAQRSYSLLLFFLHSLFLLWFFRLVFFFSTTEQETHHLLLPVTRFLNQLVHFLSPQLLSRVFSLIKTAPQHFDVFLLVPHKRRVWRISDTDMEAQRVIGSQKSWRQVSNWYELIVTPTFPNIKGRTILPYNRILDYNLICELDFVVIFVVVLETFGKFKKNWEMGSFCNSVSFWVHLQPPLYSVHSFRRGIDDSFSQLAVQSQHIGEPMKFGY